MDRIEKIRNLLAKKYLDVAIITNKVTKKYLGAVTGSGSVLVITADEVIQFMDGRYQNEQCRLTIVENRVLPSRDYYTPIIEFLKEHSYRFIGLEDEGISVSRYLQLATEFEVESIGEAIVQLRSIKDPAEIQKIRLACQVTDEIFLRVLPQIRVGMSEKELVGIVYYECFKAGADCLSFEPIIASGWRGSLPHGRPTDKLLQQGELVTIDFGIVMENYQSDMTRTIALGQVSDELLKIYDTVRIAQQAAVDAVCPGIKACEVDEVARTVIRQAGYGEYFTHGLGHGIGIGGDYPMMNAASQTILVPNMVLTCEPGIYVPNIGGVRIEDVVCVNQVAGEALTKSDKSLIVVG